MLGMRVGERLQSGSGCNQMGTFLNQASKTSRQPLEGRDCKHAGESVPQLNDMQVACQTLVSFGNSC